MDGEKVGYVYDWPRAPLELDRDRRERRTGLTWHRVDVSLIDSGGNIQASDTRRFRLVGPKRVEPGPHWKHSQRGGGGGGGGGGAGVEEGAGKGGGQGGASRVERAVFPQTAPQVCFSFMSCGRLGLLRLTVRKLIEHMDRWEAQVAYELAWLDQVPPL